MAAEDAATGAPRQGPRPADHNATDIVRQAAPSYRDWRALQAQLAAARAENKARRARVLAQPDLTERLTRPPLEYAHAEQWNGFVPPRMWAEEINTSDRRAALVQICAEALAREKAAPVTWTLTAGPARGTG